MAKYHVGEKNDWKGMKKGEKIHIFSPICKKYAYLFLNWLIIYKITKKGLKIFACVAHPPIVIISFGEKIWFKKGGGGQQYEFKFNIQPCVTVKYPLGVRTKVTDKNFFSSVYDRNIVWRTVRHSVHAGHAQKDVPLPRQHAHRPAKHRPGCRSFSGIIWYSVE